MLERLATWLVETIGTLGYAGIAVLMAVESSAVPFPSEVVMPPAGYLAYRGEMNLWLALASGILGSLAGAWINYVIALRVGRWVFVRYGRWVFLSEASLARAERYFAAHGEITTFVGRLLPAIRQLISIPAGLARMHLGRFFLFTALGSGLWCAVLLAVGWLIGRAGADPRSRDVVERYSHQALLIVAPVLLLILVVYVVRHRRREGAGTGRQAPGEETRA